MGGREANGDCLNFGAFWGQVSVKRNCFEVELGLSRSPILEVEVDENCCTCLRSRMTDGALPRAPIWSDVKTYRPSESAEPARRAKLLLAGFPCQVLDSLTIDFRFEMF